MDSCVTCLRQVWLRYLAGERIGQEHFAALPLTASERHVLFARLDGRTLQEIGTLGVPSDRPHVGMVYSRQAVKEMEKRALRKLGCAESITRAIHVAERRARARDYNQAAHEIYQSNLRRYDSSCLKARLSAIEKRIAHLEDRLEAIATQLLRESERERPTKEQIESYAQESAAIARKIETLRRRDREASGGE